MRLVLCLLLPFLAGTPLTAQPTAPPDSLGPRLARAIDNDEAATVARLLDAGAPLHSTDGEMAPLYRAARQGRTEIVRLLLERGAEVNAADPQRGTTPLDAAAYYGHEAVVQLLLDADADRQTTNVFGFAAYDWALEAGHTAIQTTLIDALLATASPDEAASLHLMRATVLGDHDRIEALLADGADPNRYNRTGYAALPLAARRGDAWAVRRLLADGADPNSGDVARDEASPLHQAARGGHVEVGRLLLDAGAHVDKTNLRGFTPLFMTALYAREPFALLLLDAGADPALRSTDPDPSMGDRTAFDFAIEQQPDAMVVPFLGWWSRQLAAGPEERRLLDALAMGEDAEATALLPGLSALNDEVGALALALAVARGRPALVRALLERGADPDRMTASGYAARALATRLDDPAVQAVMARYPSEARNASMR